MATEKLTYEKAIQKLEEIVVKLEEEEVSLEESMKLYEEAMELAVYCSDFLKKAEKKVKNLSEKIQLDTVGEANE